MPELRIKIPEELEYRLEHERPSYLDRKAFVCLLLASALDRGLTIPAYCVGAGNQVGHPQAQQEPPNAADAQGDQIKYPQSRVLEEGPVADITESNET